jgi:hypothetical protein
MEMRRRDVLFRRLRRFFRRGEAGFAMVIVLVALLMLSVLGAASLLLMVSSLKGVANMKPEQKAFQIAETGLYAAHALIVEKGILAAPFEGQILGGEYEVNVKTKNPETTTDFIVVSLGSYTEGGVTYRRKIYEEVRYSGEQAFDALRNYCLFAGRNLTISLSSTDNWIPPYINGSIRAENDLYIYNYAKNSRWHGFVVNGSVEGGNSVTLESGCLNYYTGFISWPSGTYYTPNPNCVSGNNILFYGNIKSGSQVDMSKTGTVTLKAWSGYSSTSEGGTGRSAVFAATSGTQNWTITAPQVRDVTLATHDKIFRGNVVNNRGVGRIYIPKPNFEYYKIMAQEQGNYRVGDWSITGDIRKSGASSMTVFYCTGDMTMTDTDVRDPNTNAVFVCEGNFTFKRSHRLRPNCTFQVIAGKNVIVDNDAAGSWDDVLTNSYFLYAMNDINMIMDTFSTTDQQYVYFQATALRDLYITQAGGRYSYPNFSYRPPQIDVAAWPIDITVLNWKELPTDVPPSE